MRDARDPDLGVHHADATLEPPSPAEQELFGAINGNRAAMDDFASVISGVLSPADFFAEENVGRIVAEARQPVA